MTVLPWVGPHDALPDPHHAQPDGLLAAGLDLGPARLEAAYRKGIFPWFNEGDPVLWWSPDPRMVLACCDLIVSHSMAKKLRQLKRSESIDASGLQIRVDTAFNQVIDACSAPRKGQPGTWISPQIKAAYGALHDQGKAHSIETWLDGKLIGGLYGVSLGGFFFGESMFSHAPDASKLALVYLTGFLKCHGVEHIDCQQETPHLASLGAKPVPRAVFMSWLSTALNRPPPPWRSGTLLQNGTIAPLP
ncbi:leucyl/phenylalanyl-tRNA--protein transferase [Pusillimonas sp. NJUB218]|uniref:leucyl/phenylalanyl-tRNA--protein transferase n=1 Tax=Pusillimonas sp. NJUB218 TaxID=2023230 RepID=UPI000F4B789D|nr:leucyl/phenylalanyl-tRNA--protein transferase [Pusillimonas sp. NJUB218]ROT45531.1 leucyl/phenylalanyl-tRNA--protein transferase [Pusillimonas sp. NJUB218]